MRKFLKIFFLLCIAARINAQWAVSDFTTQTLIMLGEEGRVTEILKDFSRVAASAVEVQKSVKTYKKILEDIMCDNSDLFALLMRIERYGLRSCLLASEIRLLNFNFSAQIRVFDIIADVAKAVAKGTSDKGAMDSFASTEKKLLTALEDYHAKRKEIKKIEQKLLAVESIYLRYDREVEIFEKTYDKAFIN